MAGWDRHTGRAALLLRDNIDTDQLIPARFMSAPRAQGYGAFLLYDLRRDADGAPDPDFPLNRDEAFSVLISGENFGSGSSREAAIYALVDAGFRAVIALGFGDIFAANAVNNGLLPAVVSKEVADALTASGSLETEDIAIDLQTRTLELGDQTFPFAIQDAWQAKLINGWDDIDLALRHHADIDAFWNARQRAAPWAAPSDPQVFPPSKGGAKGTWEVPINRAGAKHPHPKRREKDVI